ncbi:hypothetical protein U1Q18_031600, partial [Sarracenia purpurea var. burkii]
MVLLKVFWMSSWGLLSKCAGTTLKYGLCYQTVFLHLAAFRNFISVEAQWRSGFLHLQTSKYSGETLGAEISSILSIVDLVQ